MIPLNKKALKTVFLDTVPVLTGYLFLGMGFGILLAEQTGKGIGWALGMSVFLFAGSGQYLAVSLMAKGASLLSAALALRKREDPYALLLDGAKDGLKLLLTLIPTLILLLTAVTMFRASGAAELLSGFLSPVFGVFGIPPETAILVLIRPVSGSAALAVGADLMRQYGVDSQIGRTVAVMLGSTETTFYTVSVYFGAAGIKKTRYTIPAALIADLTGFLVASLTARLFFR